MPPHRPRAALRPVMRATPRSMATAGPAGKALGNRRPWTLGRNPVTGLRRTSPSGDAPREDRGVASRAAPPVLLVVVLLDVDRPYVVVGAEQVLDAQHGGV